MKQNFNHVYQFKITLKEIKPPIWRRIQVPKTYSFWDLHVTIQDAMGWLDYHLHQFEMVDPSTGMKVEIGIPDEESGWFDREILPGWKEKITNYFILENRLATYTYDFGDDWKHSVRLEKILPRNKNISYTICVDGKRACPPEDCGGIWGYEELLEIIINPDHEEYEEMLTWLGGEYDPEHFDVKKVHFDDPEKRRKIAFG
ncbi:MAG: plasmid pRiA4b ORF-3 family protein [bacterium]